MSLLILNMGVLPHAIAWRVVFGVGAVLGIDPEADMLTVARRAAQRSGVSNVSWMLGTDRDMPALRQLLGGILSSMVVDMRLRFRRP